MGCHDDAKVVTMIEVIVPHDTLMEEARPQSMLISWRQCVVKDIKVAY